jgi:ABC-2 type transport system ATP-binding protein
MFGLELREVSKSFGEKQVVDKVSFASEGGEILGFLGPNGAGKTTTIRILMGIIAADEGKVIYRTEKGFSEIIPKSSIGYLPEERGLYKEAKVLNVLGFLAGLKSVAKKEARERALQWLDKFALKDYSQAKIEELSKGMSQKIQFIASILHKPKLLILDEPFSGLDPVSQDLFKAELRRLAEEGTTILLSSHQMNIMEELCNRIFLIHQGKEVFYGTLPEIKEKYGNYKVTLSVTENYDFNRLTGLSFVADSERLNALEYEISLKEKTQPGEFLTVIDKDCPIRELKVSRSSLHDIFVKIALGREENE